MKLTRRAFLAASAAAFPFRAAAQGQGLEDYEPLIIRPPIDGVDPRYAAYATDGPLLYPSVPVNVRTSRSAVLLFAPRNAPSARLVVFSHGALADPLTYRRLLWHWTSHGYVVAAPLHADAVIESGPTLRNSRPGEVSDWPVAKLLEDPEAWRERTLACSAVLDDLKTLEAACGVSIDAERPVIAGHGYGAYMAQILTGATVTDGDGRRLDMRDPRFFSGIVMSPQGPGVMGFTEDSWAAVSAPMLYLVAEDDLDFTEQPAMEKAKAYRLAKPGYKHIGFLKGASANTFSGGLVRTDERELALFRAVLAMTTAFLDAYAAYDTEAFHDMTTDLFERMTLGAVDEGRR